MNHRGESMEEDDMVMSIGNSLSTGDEPIGEGRAASQRDLIRRCQGLAEGWPWQPPKEPLHVSASGGIDRHAFTTGCDKVVYSQPYINHR